MTGQIGREPLKFDPVAEAQRRWTERGLAGDSLGMAVVTSVLRVRQLLVAEADEVLRPHGLTFSRFEALLLLAFSNDGSLSLGKLGQRLCVGPANITSTMDRLEVLGLARRRPHQSDKRATLAEVSDKGRRLVDELLPQVNDRVLSLIGLDDDDMRQLVALTRHIRLTAGEFDA